MVVVVVVSVSSACDNRIVACLRAAVVRVKLDYRYIDFFWLLFKGRKRFLARELRFVKVEACRLTAEETRTAVGEEKPKKEEKKQKSGAMVGYIVSTDYSSPLTHLKMR